MKISNIVRKVLLRYPLFGNIIANLNFKLTNELVPASIFTDGETIYYKTEFISEYSEDEQEFMISHEIFHIVLSHLFRNIGKDRDLLNYVEDAIINQLLIKDGLKSPKGLVYVENALDYSVDELYMKFLPKIKEIKEWMGANTYHMEINILSEQLNEMLEKIYNRDLQELMADNGQIRNEMARNYEEELKKKAQEGYGKFGYGIEFPNKSVGKALPLLYWKELLNQNLLFPEELTTSFYEVQMDGIIKKEGKPDETDSESEIIIDSSGSMNMAKIKVILRECKNILSVSHIKVGFCDVDFYGWNEIRTNEDIDNLKIIGRGGTNFVNMAESFSKDADNKIVITDGECDFPTNHPEILWIVINYHIPYRLSSNYLQSTGQSKPNINMIFINEKDITVPMILERK